MATAPKKVATATKKPTPTVAAKASAAPGSTVKSTSDAPVSLGRVGDFEFAMTVWPEIPALPTRAASSLALPFRGWFPKMVHNGEVFVPTSFWIDQREVEPEKVTAGYVKAKIRDAFRKWQRDEPEASAGHSLVLIAREPGDDNGRITQAGMSVFMQITKES